MPRPIRAAIQPEALAHNLRVIAARLPGRTLMPVVKANAYGHGLARVIGGLQAADQLAILELDGALELRRLGWTKPIVLLEGCFGEEDMQAARHAGLDWVIHDHAQLEALRVAMPNWPKEAHKPRLYLKLNTGMNRLGFDAQGAAAAIELLDKITTSAGWPAPVLMTHFANADSHDLMRAHPGPEGQFNALMALKPAHWASSLANSAGVFNCPQWAGDVVRPGIAVYGATPGPHSAADYGLLPAMALTSQIIAVQQVPAGQRVGYGSRWLAQRDSRIAVIACGYADGYPRHAPDGTPVWLQGTMAPVAGRVSMDMMSIDITEIPSAGVGTEVELWGNNLSVDVVAHHCGTIGYELLCAVTPRVPFVVM
ncbi:MAG: alanine racemase [Limnobacter sp.]|uniref:alanine racemase n=1 Tax=Limnobacter sp. TaxID=2003368 RepID=UPI00391C8F29